MIAWIRETLFGKRCELHDVQYRSDFCPQCLGARVARAQTSDANKRTYQIGGTATLKEDACLPEI